VQVGLVNAELRVNPLVLELRAEVASLRQTTEHLRVSRILCPLHMNLSHRRALILSDQSYEPLYKRIHN
jgi:hypothetical protein